jgi:hypothetical protein
MREISFTSEKTFRTVASFLHHSRPRKGGASRNETATKAVVPQPLTALETKEDL